jgi:hypothetical protein
MSRTCVTTCRTYADAAVIHKINLQALLKFCSSFHYAFSESSDSNSKTAIMWGPRNLCVTKKMVLMHAALYENDFKIHVKLPIAKD